MPKKQLKFIDRIRSATSAIRSCAISIKVSILGSVVLLPDYSQAAQPTNLLVVMLNSESYSIL